MQQNILKASNVTKIYLTYVDGKNYRKKEEVKLRYIDNKSCYFVGPTIINFNKPRWRTKTDIVVYTPDGVYTATVILRDAEFNLNNIYYKVDVPKTWKYTQLRAGSRKEVKLPLKLKFNDGLEIDGETLDLSVGGFSFVSRQELSTVHMRFACNCQMFFPKDMTINFPDGILEVDAKYVRSKAITDNYELEGHKVLSFKFLNLTTDYEMIIKNFLMKIE